MIKKSLPLIKKLHFNSFPATHLKTLAWYDYCIKFSSEALVFVLCFSVFATNLYFFYLNRGVENISDNSHMARLLAKHPQFNPKLYAKNTSILTTMESRGFIAQARADDFEGLSNQGLGQSPEEENNLVITNDAIVKPNPDSISDLIAKQIKVYETKEGDTLKSLSQHFGISTNTIVWANKLPSQQIKPGWQLLILPTDGVIVTANSNTTLPDIAKKYKADMDTIIAYNGMANAESFDEGQIIIIPGGTIAPPPAPKPAPKNRNDGKVKPEGVSKPQSVDNGTGHVFPWGYCTWYVATKVHIPFGGNAKVWLKNAQSSGIQTGKIPVPGAVVVTNESRYGHVAYVHSVSEDSFTVSEMNYVKFGKVSTRTISKSSKAIKGFIYP